MTQGLVRHHHTGGLHLLTRSCHPRRPHLASSQHKATNERIATDPTVHDHLGQVYEKTGKLKLAVAQWERSMSEYARSLPADADPADVAKVQHKLENARVKLARLTPTTSKN